MDKRKWNLRISISVLVLVAVPLWFGLSMAQDEWPRQLATKEGKITVYQPQLESFKGDKVSARAALSIQRKDAKAPIFGVVWFSARAMTNRDTRLVEFTDLKIERVKFPFATKDQEKTFADFLKEDVENWERSPMALDRFLAQIAAIEREKASSDQLGTDPPRIIFTTIPSALILINGKPELRKVENSDLERVVNTPFAILYVPSTKTYYLKGGDFWYSSSDVMGPWRTVENPPSVVIEIVNKVAPKEDETGAPGDEPKPKVPPQIIVATEPTELIVADGQPKFESVQGTGLLYMSNTPSEVFMEIKTQQYYVVLAGRWYRSGSLDKGPWTFVLADKLPPDFMKIPPGSVKGHILAFVAGTAQAQEAVLDAQIPQTAAIKKSEAKLTVTYDGSPKFNKIRGTGMEYAVNAGTPVLRMQGRYYACDQAVWFTAETPEGPWIIAEAIPDEIDTIPPDSPVYNVKYVHIYDSTPEVVYVGYTPGYVGSYVYGDTVVYGTGYVYPTWLGAFYFPWPFTWGFAPIYDPFYCSWGFGWGFGAGFVTGVGWGVGWGWGPYYGWGWGWAGWRPWWGYGPHPPYHPYPYPHPYNHPYGHINRPINVTHPVNPHGPVGVRPEARQNLYNHGNNATRNARPPGEGTPNQNWRGPGNRPPGQNPRTTQQRSARQWERSNPKRDNNVFAGRDGSVYRRTDKGWQQRTPGGWSRAGASPQTRQNFSQSQPGLERDFSARQRGYERSTNFGRITGGYGGYGGFRGGYPGGGGLSGGGPRGGSSGGHTGGRGHVGGGGSRH